VPRLVLLDQRREDVEAGTGRRAGPCFHESLDLLERCTVVRRRLDGANLHGSLVGLPAATRRRVRRSRS
jgi:hypothetical protein